MQGYRKHFSEVNLVVLATEWEEFKDIDYKELGR